MLPVRVAACAWRSLPYKALKIVSRVGGRHVIHSRSSIEGQTEYLRDSELKPLKKQVEK
jgi:hypothetical protein